MAIDESKYKVYTWKNWMYIHWIINPGLIINEVILGQRVPKIALEDKTSDLPRIERSFIPCPHCKKIHDARIWSAQNGTAFKNWFGLFCPNCEQIIPCIMNIFSSIILIITYPIWGLLKNKLKMYWLSKQPERYSGIVASETPNYFSGKGWVKVGLAWGAFMFLLMVVVTPIIQGKEITIISLLIGLPVWLCGGLGFGYFMKLSMNKKGKSKTS